MSDYHARACDVTIGEAGSVATLSHVSSAQALMQQEARGGTCGGTSSAPRDAIMGVANPLLHTYPRHPTLP